MATYAIGDLQGCADALERLLDRLAFDPARDRLWLVGDLVNRGPDSLRTLRTVRALGDAARIVLGNHDLHLLALTCGVKRPSAADTLDALIGAPDAHELTEWLRFRPLAVAETIEGKLHLMVHAGVLPDWSVEDVLCRASEVEAVLCGKNWRDFITALYGDEPSHWDEALSGHARLRFIVNALTRLRFCNAKGELDLTTKEGAAHAKPGFAPWFEMPKRQTAACTVVFGHWSTMGLVDRPNLLGLDTGCVWGGALTAVHLENRALVQVACPQYRVPG